MHGGHPAIRTVLQVFTDDEVAMVRERLGELVRALRQVPGGGKMEEDSIPYRGWQSP
jgi:hypothetical protein